MSRMTRRMPVGAEPQPDGGTSFRVWAPRPRELQLVMEAESRRDIPLTRDEAGYCEAVVEGAGPGSRYWDRLDGELRPDPASRFQPDGPFGPSEIADPASYRWRDVMLVLNEDAGLIAWADPSLDITSEVLKRIQS